MPINRKSTHAGDMKLNQDPDGKAMRVCLLDFSTAPMRAFHLSWFAFFVCFVAWFGIAPLMAVVRDDLKLTKAQIGNTVIASVAITVLARLLAGWLRLDDDPMPRPSRHRNPRSPGR